MGNQQSQPNIQTKDTNTKEFANTVLPMLVDKIAAEYILTQNFRDLQKLDNEAYCNRLTILTSQVIQNRLTARDVTFLKERKRAGYIIPKKETDTVVFLKKSDLEKLDIQDPLKKKRICIGISRFYIRIAHLFASIVNTINPVYSYQDLNGVNRNVAFNKFTSIPTNLRHTVKISKSGMCSKRIKSLSIKTLSDTDTTKPSVKTNNQLKTMTQKYSQLKKTSNVPILNIQLPTQNIATGKINVQTQQPKQVRFENTQQQYVPLKMREIQLDTNIQKGGNKRYTVTNNVCTLNTNKKISSQGQVSYSTKVLSNIPGIPELANLYKDVFNYKTGRFDDMSDAAKAIYMRDLTTFYTTFTGKKVLPDGVTNFNQIPLKAYHQSTSCRDSDAPINKTYSGFEIDDALMSQYAKNMATMVKNMNDKQNRLIEILDDVFIYYVNPDDNKKTITIHPELTNDKLDILVDRARNYIVDIMTSCENDYTNTLQSYEAIIAHLSNKINVMKTQNIQKQKEVLVAEGIKTV